jgi:hypothetical protein
MIPVVAVAAVVVVVVVVVDHQCYIVTTADSC